MVLYYVHASWWLYICIQYIHINHLYIHICIYCIYVYVHLDHPSYLLAPLAYCEVLIPTLMQICNCWFTYFIYSDCYFSFDDQIYTAYYCTHLQFLYIYIEHYFADTSMSSKVHNYPTSKFFTITCLKRKEPMLQGLLGHLSPHLWPLGSQDKKSTVV